ncbi:NfeD family protein [Nocardia otitidiscaviarum]|uniref:NfeD family protein n=1 Tax=Nocardia otitidiscaviarum TaxID=1823 RepID=A0A379JM09_9NOCA|nr:MULTISPECIES: NfeD family protein [Nocardia]MBF6137428.1 NfeD family protein [Nocardia otitidiscaviarum]MBF6182184.1 NfeD family protein [Nocardia otitidiscaviarum]MBF6241144.1 NfeD family protein [Nocardia otitidiscaviarum]MBF6488311.1 NfeD family protein [Nocardia otitidiscaviarum]MCP9624758.1 NfeD family protein [Nocardia otitidiscaviarum]
MAAIIWLVAGLLLAAAEVLVGDLTLLMLGSAALVTAGVSGLTDTSLIVDAVVFGISAVALMLVVRPVLLRRYAVRPAKPMGMEALPGKTARVLEPVDEHGGRVKLEGEVWSARPLDPSDRYEEGATVYVAEIDGATAVVWKGP